VSYQANKRSELARAFRRHQAAIASAINTRRATFDAGEVVTLRSGVQIVIRHGVNGYEVAGLAAPTRPGEG
jgi:hypothetical protein